MSEIGEALAFAAQLYGEKARIAYSGYARRDLMARLHLRDGRANPYPIYERIRERGTLVPTRVDGDWVTASHRVCHSVLRSRRFGVQPPDGSNFSFLGMNPPDHTRLRRLVQPAFSPKAVASYRHRIERTVADLLDRAAAAGEFDPGSVDLRTWSNIWVHGRCGRGRHYRNGILAMAGTGLSMMRWSTSPGGT